MGSGPVRILEDHLHLELLLARGLEDAAFTTVARELGRPLSVDDVRPAATEAMAEVFDLELEPVQAPLPARV